MTGLREVDAVPETEVTAAASDRRRPGRLDTVSPELISILRGGDQCPSIEFEEAEADQASAMRGLCFGVLLSAPIWVAIAYVGTWVLS